MSILGSLLANFNVHLNWLWRYQKYGFAPKPNYHTKFQINDALSNSYFNWRLYEEIEL